MTACTLGLIAALFWISGSHASREINRRADTLLALICAAAAIIVAILS